MSLISRHILRSLAPPFVWGVLALTGLLLLASLAGLINKLGGKGVPWNLMVEAIALTLPAFVALTIPMGVLIATLYAYGQLSTDLEMVAMYANGISVWRMARPALVAAGFIAVVNFLLFDQLVPRMNEQYRALMSDVANTRPTLAIKAREINLLAEGSEYLLWADEVQPDGDMIYRLTIYDLGATGVRRILRADSGMMVLAPNQTDLQMTLYHGTSLAFPQFPPGVPATTRRSEFTTFLSDRLTIRSVVSQLQRTAGMGQGDREMSSCELLDGIEAQQWYIDHGNRQREQLTRRNLRRLAGLPELPPPGIELPPKVPEHCGIYREAEKWLKEQLLSPMARQALLNDSINNAAWVADSLRNAERIEAARKQTTDQIQAIPLGDTIRPVPQSPIPATPPAIPPAAPPAADSGSVAVASTTSAPPSTPPVIPPATPPLDSNSAAARPAANTPTVAPAVDSMTAATPQATLPVPPDRLRQAFPASPADSLLAMMEVNRARQESRTGRRQLAAFAVEFHKKYAIPLASFCFVLLGLALALKFPRGGIGLVIGGSLVIFMIFYIFIIGGENLAKKEFVSPALAMHGPLALFTLLGLISVSAANREMGSMRSSSLFSGLGFRRMRRRKRST